MKYTVTQKIDCTLITPTEEPFEIDGFLFLRESGSNNVAKYIQTTVDAYTKEEAQRKAHKHITQFLFKIAVVNNMQYTLLGVAAISDGTITTASRSISTRVSIGIDGNTVKDNFVKITQAKRLRMRPMQHYADGLNASDPFDKFRNFYLVLEHYLPTTRQITHWIQSKLPTIEMKLDSEDRSLTVISWIRHKLSHAKKGNKGIIPLSISNPKDVQLVQQHLPVVQQLAREMIKEKEKI
jgi:hypothetical protein